MDTYNHQLSHESQSADHGVVESNSYNYSEAQCIICRRAFILETGLNEGFELICRECKSLVLDDNEASATIPNFHQRSRRRGRASRYASSESMEDLFSQQFSQLIGLVRQSHEIQVDDGDVTFTTPPRASYSTARNWSRSWRRPLSDNDSESLDHGESQFGESDSNVSFYGGDSDASLDGHSLLGREMFPQLDNESHIYTDTDIDPMHAGLDQWNSEDQDEDEDEGWEEVNMEEALVQLAEPHGQIQDTFGNPNRSIGHAQSGRWVRWQVRHADFFSDEDSHVPPFVANSGDYLDARGFEELLEQLAETDGSRRGAPPTAASVVRSLPDVIISKDHEEKGSLVCAVCKDPLPMDTKAKQLPCLHLYHPTCILPWLSARNSCPVCRYELPTDDPDYEEGKLNMGRSEVHEIRREGQGESFSDVSSDVEVDDAHNEYRDARAEQAEANVDEHVADSLNRRGESGGRRWFFLPIVSIVGIALALWFRDSVSDGRIHCRIGDRDHQQSQRSQVPSVLADRNRRWWCLF